jgi:hypothetical protein
VFTAFALVLFVQVRPDYLHPTEIGTDVSTYFGAGQRLISGHEIYAMSPGDRPMPIWPPFWTVPLVGPPTIAVLWAPLVVFLPPIVSIYGWWLAAFAATTATYLWIVTRGNAPVVVAAALLSFATIITGMTGNVNGLLIGGLSAVWFLSRGPRTASGDVAIGVILALATAVKFGPAVFGLWLLAEGRWRAAVAATVAGLAIAVVTVLVAGPDIVPTYLRLAGDTATGGVTAQSVGGALRSIGLPEVVVVAAPLGVIVLSGLLAFAFRRRPGVAFSIVAVGATFAVPVVRYETLSFLLVALVPWTRPLRGSPSAVGVAE